MNMQHLKHMEEAVAVARQGAASGAGGPFGAVLANSRGHVIARAHNEVLKRNDPTCHAEIMALRAAGSFDLSGHTLYASGYPCPMCLSAILWARIPTIYYCNDYEAAKAIGFDDDAFMRALGEIYGCSPAFSVESRTQLLTVKRLFIPQGKELYDFWMSMPERRMY